MGGGGFFFFVLVLVFWGLFGFVSFFVLTSKDRPSQTVEQPVSDTLLTLYVFSVFCFEVDVCRVNQVIRSRVRLLLPRTPNKFYGVPDLLPT